MLLNMEKNSKYYDWFYIKDDFVEMEPPNYLTFAFEKRMPKLNTSNKDLREYLISVAKYWIQKFDIDGWRLDVSDEIDHKFWREFRDEVKKLKSDAIILGENWFNSYPWLQGDQYDGVMNYPITKACLDFFGENIINAQQFCNMVSSIIFRNTHISNNGMLNLLDSHDTPRFITLCGGQKEKMKMALAFIFSFVGMPCIYYGTEILLEGKGDPDCRRTFNWDMTSWDLEFFEYVKTLINMRKKEKVLKHGEIKLYTHKDLFVMERFLQDEKIILIINNSNLSWEFTLKGKKIENLLINEIIEHSEEKLEIMIEKNNCSIYKVFN